MMEIIIKMNGKKISHKKAEELIGKTKLDSRIKQAIEEKQDDPLTLVDWMDGMEIDIAF